MTEKKLISEHGVVNVTEDLLTGERALQAAKAFRQGDVITLFYPAEVLATASRLTIQKDNGLHITLFPFFLQYVNHSCSPNAFFDTAAMQFVALTDVEEGEELTFFYPSTEWEMAQAFLCRCEKEDCLHSIRGAAFLPDEVLGRYRLTDFILRKLAEREEARA